MTYSVLRIIFGNSVQVKIVEFFLVNSSGMYQLTDISRELGISHSRVHDLIGGLVKLRIVSERRSKRNRLFEFNEDHPISKKLKELYVITRAFKLAEEY